MEKMIVCRKVGFFTKSETREYKYDETVIDYPIEAEKYIHHLWSIRANFTIDFVTEENLRTAKIGNSILAKMTGLELICR